MKSFYGNPQPRTIRFGTTLYTAPYLLKDRDPEVDHSAFWSEGRVEIYWMFNSLWRLASAKL